MKRALLIVNLGTPNKPTYFSVFKYLRQFLMDRRVININPILRFFLVNLIICPTRSFSSTKIYKKVWNKETGSPLLHNTKKLAEKIQSKLPEYIVEYAMRYQSPSIKKALNKLLIQNPDEIIILPLFPHYAAATTGSVYEEVSRILSKKWVVPKIKFINQLLDSSMSDSIDKDKDNDIDISELNTINESFKEFSNIEENIEI